MSTRPSIQGSSITVRPAVPEDAEKLRELRLAALAAHPEAFAMDAESVATETVAQWAERITRNIATHAGTICVAADGDQFIGMMGLYRDLRPKTRHSGTIWGVYVDAAWRGHRVAEALMSECLAWARGQGLVVVKLGVITSNTPAIRCYARCGFTVYGIEPKVIHCNNVFYDELLMARSI
jgi:RimJ/RimL family protein N-acetyltransferase